MNKYLILGLILAILFSGCTTGSGVSIFDSTTETDTTSGGISDINPISDNETQVITCEKACADGIVCCTSSIN